jgi:hypothetical protein
MQSDSSSYSSDDWVSDGDDTIWTDDRSHASRQIEQEHNSKRPSSSLLPVFIQHPPVTKTTNASPSVPPISFERALRYFLPEVLIIKVVLLLCISFLAYTYLNGNRQPCPQCPFCPADAPPERMEEVGKPIQKHPNVNSRLC